MKIFIVHYDKLVERKNFIIYSYYINGTVVSLCK